MLAGISAAWRRPSNVFSLRMRSRKLPHKSSCPISFAGQSVLTGPVRGSNFNNICFENFKFLAHTRELLSNCCAPLLGCGSLDAAVVSLAPFSASASWRAAASSLPSVSARSRSAFALSSCARAAALDFETCPLSCSSSPRAAPRLRPSASTRCRS